MPLRPSPHRLKEAGHGLLLRDCSGGHGSASAAGSPRTAAHSAGARLQPGAERTAPSSGRSTQPPAQSPAHPQGSNHPLACPYGEESLGLSEATIWPRSAQPREGQGLGQKQTVAPAAASAWPRPLTGHRQVAHLHPQEHRDPGSERRETEAHRARGCSSPEPASGPHTTAACSHPHLCPSSGSPRSRGPWFSRNS